MFPSTLILAAISAAFASGIPPPIDPCDLITEKLQTAFGPQDPRTLLIIPNVSYIRLYVRYNLDLFDLTFAGFSNVSCSSFNPDNRVTTLNLTGHNLEFGTREALLDINPRRMVHALLPTSFNLQLVNYTLELRFEIDSYTTYSFNLCINNGSLNMIFHADGTWNNVGVSQEVTQELNDHPYAVLKAINLYLPHFANNLTTTLNNILCIDYP
ncbi:uncharacterized protein [Palaemon carinicauda]|uniref:uncharacterized protein n=1 Tax=Palaemon carinicauda TaxID=392227 RepID=UPI0035B58492